MTDRDALLATIEAHPDDDLPRLVYADWLEEHAHTDADRARAAFIRLQIAEYRAAAEWDPQSSAHPSVRMIRPHVADWLPGVPAALRHAVMFERGFPAALKPNQQIPAALGLLADLPDALRTVDRLHVSRGDHSATAADADRPGLARLRGLSLKPAYHEADHPLLGSPYLSRVESLSAEWLNAAGVRAAARNPALANVRRVSFDSADGPAFAAAAFPRLEAVRIGSLRFTRTAGPDERQALARSGVLRPVRRLGWSGAAADAALDAVASGQCAPGLEVLALHTPPDQVGPLFRRLALPRLRQLTLSGVGVAGALEHLGRSPAAARLDGLALNGASAGADAVRVFECPNLLGLKRLDLYVPQFDAGLFDYLMTSDRPLEFDSFYLSWHKYHVPVPAALAALREKYGARWRENAVYHSIYRRLHPNDVP